MQIGIDFDNTIVSYDILFHKVAVEQKIVPESTPVNKVAVRDYLRKIDKEDIWTEMQGYVYGARMDEASAYPGVLEFMHRAKQAGHTLAIVSHKTRHPFIGPQYDLHAAARRWIDHHLLWNGKSLVDKDCIFFEITKEEKLARATALSCELFIDDLPEILKADGFPQSARPLLFDPEGHHQQAGLERCASWVEIGEQLGLK